MKKLNNTFILMSLVFGLCSCDKTPETVNVKFENYDKTVLYEAEIDYGTIAEYKGENPVREQTVDTVYSFSGWDKNINEELYEDTVFTAQYDEEVREYVVTFVNWDGTVLFVDNVDYGSYAYYGGGTPSKSSDNEYIEYKFSGWDENLTTFAIIQDTTFTAQFDTIEYVFASFFNYDDSLLKKEKTVKNTVPYYSGSTPVRKYDGDEEKAYRFKAWDKPLEAISEDTSYKAVFDLLDVYTVTFKNYNDSVLQKVKVVHGDTAVYTGSTPYKAGYTSGRYTYTYEFAGWSKSLTNVQSSFETVAQFRENVTYEYTDEEKVINHLSQYGSGSYDMVSTGSGSTLGYSGGYFYLSYSNYSSLETDFVLSFSYGSSYGSSLFYIYDGSTLMFKASFYVYFSNHRYSSMSVGTIYTSYYTSSSQLEAVASLAMLSAQYACNNASTYLYSHNLPYIM